MSEITLSFIHIMYYKSYLSICQSVMCTKILPQTQNTYRNPLILCKLLVLETLKGSNFLNNKSF